MDTRDLTRTFVVLAGILLGILFALSSYAGAGFPTGLEDCNSNLIPDSHETSVQFDQHTISSFPENTGAHVFSGDIDGDGDLDVVVGLRTLDRIVWYEHLDGGGSFGPQQIISTEVDAPEYVFAADLDGDGDLDVLSASSMDDKIAWYENLDGLGSFGPQQVISIENKTPTSVVAADLDGDDDPDVLVGSYSDGEVTWYENYYGAGVFGPQRSIATDLPASNTRAVDLDLDGDLDVLSTGSLESKIVWYENVDGSGAFGPERLVGIMGPNFAVMAKDLDSDGDLDVVAVTPTPGGQCCAKVSWFEHLDGAGTFGPEQVIDETSPSHLTWVVAVDLDVDGDNDILVTHFASAIGWYENLDGTGAFSSEQQLTTTLDNYTNFVMGDIDRDGDLDFFTGGIGPSSSPGLLRWFENVAVDCNGNDVPDDCDLTAGTVDDCDGDGIPDACELTTGLAFDCNDNGTLDGCDLSGGTSQDCASDGVPDECEPDCNGNAQADSCDILGGLGDVDSDGIPDACETDCNGNGQPDEFDIVEGASGDCDGNEIPDECDVAAGTYADCNDNLIPDLCESDCNENGQPDGCDIADGTSIDGDGNGVPDECEPDCNDNGVLDGIETELVFAEEVACSDCNVVKSFPVDLDRDGDVDLLSGLSDDDQVVWFRNLDGNGLFGPPVVIADGQPNSVFAADLDGDGDPDILAALPALGNFSWYENLDGLGTFGDPRIINEADSPQDVFAADVDGDGDKDVLSGAQGLDQVAWHENLDGLGTFGPPRIIAQGGERARSIFAADLDGDEDVDLLVGSTGDNGAIEWYENLDGAGTFGPSKILLPDDSYAVFVSDIDGDGSMDAVCTRFLVDEVAWFRNLDGAGTFSPPQVITTQAYGVRSVFVEDLDGDGDKDVVSGSPSDNKVAWYENLDGLGAFGSQTIIDDNGDGADLSGTRVLVADLDRDGDSDVIARSLLWYRNETPDCNGNDIPDECELDDGSSVDVNANGILDECEPDCNGNDQPDSTDIASASSSDCNTNGIPDECEIVSGSSPDCDTNGIPDECEGPDCNGNYVIDLCDIASGLSGDCDGSGIPDECEADFIGRLVGFGDGVRSVVAAKIDGDAHVDVVAASPFDDKIAWFENDGAAHPNFLEHVITQDPDGPLEGQADGAWSVHVADLDGDDDLDVLSASANDDKIAWYENLDGEGSFGPQRLLSAVANGARSVFAADLDGDLDLDVLSASDTDDKVAWYENVGGGIFSSQQIITTTANGAWSVFAADLDGDLDNDVVSASWVDDDVAWYENVDGAGTFGPKQIIDSFAGDPRSVFAIDLDGDDDLDVLSASSGSDRIAWYENLDGLGSFGSPQTISLAADNAQAVFALDMDGDGNPEVLSASADDDKIALYWNLGEGVFSDERVLAQYTDGAWSVHAADLDGDGDPDVVSASSGDDQVRMHSQPDLDCNHNEVPDACEIAEGSGEDCNADGLLDECGPPLADSDLDGVCDLGDCDLTDDQVWEEPAPLDTLALFHDPVGGTTTLSWNAPDQPGATAVRYDLLRSTEPSDFLVPATCLETDELDTTGADAETPPSGSLFSYLVRVENDCPGSDGTMGSDSAGVPRTGLGCP